MPTIIPFPQQLIAFSPRTIAVQAKESAANGKLKRGIDILGGTIGLTLSLPVMAVASACIYIESRGSVIYSQTRVGKNGKQFTIFKLRSMVLDSEPDGKAGWTVAEDPRKLRIGSFLRNWSLDELPQFWNVIKGDMSLVGPRPERPAHVDRLQYEIPGYNLRHLVKPGLTGLAQVRGWRGDTDLRQRVKCDLEYIRNMTIFSDLKILLKTCGAFRSAY